MSDQNQWPKPGETPEHGSGSQSAAGEQPYGQQAKDPWSQSGQGTAAQGSGRRAHRPGHPYSAPGQQQDPYAQQQPNPYGQQQPNPYAQQPNPYAAPGQQQGTRPLRRRPRTRSRHSRTPTRSRRTRTRSNRSRATRTRSSRARTTPTRRPATSRTPSARRRTRWRSCRSCSASPRSRSSSWRSCSARRCDPRPRRPRQDQADRGDRRGLALTGIIARLGDDRRVDPLDHRHLRVRRAAGRPTPTTTTARTRERSAPSSPRADATAAPPGWPRRARHSARRPTRAPATRAPAAPARHPRADRTRAPATRAPAAPAAPRASADHVGEPLAQDRGVASLQTGEHERDAARPAQPQPLPELRGSTSTPRFLISTVPMPSAASRAASFFTSSGMVSTTRKPCAKGVCTARSEVM